MKEKKEAGKKARCGRKGRRKQGPRTGGHGTGQGPPGQVEESPDPELGTYELCDLEQVTSLDSPPHGNILRTQHSQEGGAGDYLGRATGPQ